MANYTKGEKVLELKNVRQYFSSGWGRKKVVVKAVHNISFDVFKGEVFGLVGESGCGKTTTGRTIIKLYNITDGDIYFKGQRIASGTRSKKIAIDKAKLDILDKKEELTKFLAETKAEMSKQDESSNEYIRAQEDMKSAQEDLDKFIEDKKIEIENIKKDILKSKKDNNPAIDFITKMQMIFQDPIDSLNPRMTVREIIAEGLLIRGERDQEVMTKEVERVLGLVGLLPEHANRYPHEFSGGQRQRIGIARALIVNPELIIADEPISALDVSIQAQVINLLNELREKFDLTILFIAHNLSVVKYFCDRIGVMYYGRLVELATTEELFKHPL
ncbi:MAG: dipeptide/oligopeptide/nickel ABC transporter ATP-binding protein, partial [Bacilli bacterium]|nr:dipeptide/oligopeptide/nickel ABC transporter ATP-binding protein [Bacilli bacterium]